jgi:tRNA threonylcarbamoyladenosine biosynthesis protein TsaE
MKILMKSQIDTDKLGKAIAEISKPGLVIILSGGLATGKTTLVKSIVKYLDYDDIVTSPTYTLSNVYNCKKLRVVHSDFYRLESHNEIYGLGLDIYMDTSLNLIEWGEKYIDIFDNYLHIELELSQNNRDSRLAIVNIENLDDADKNIFHDFLTSNLN